MASPVYDNKWLDSKKPGKDYTVDILKKANAGDFRQTPESDPVAEAKAFLQHSDALHGPQNAYANRVAEESTPQIEPLPSFPRYAADAMSGKWIGNELTHSGHPILGGLAHMATYGNPVGTALSGLQQLIAPEADQSRLAGSLDVAMAAMPLAKMVKANTALREAEGVAGMRPWVTGQGSAAPSMPPGEVAPLEFDTSSAAAGPRATRYPTPETQQHLQNTVRAYKGTPIAAEELASPGAQKYMHGQYAQNNPAFRAQEAQGMFGGNRSVGGIHTNPLRPGPEADAVLSHAPSLEESGNLGTLSSLDRAARQARMKERFGRAFNSETTGGF